MKIKCNKCGYIGNENEFPMGLDFCQKPFVKSCPKTCGNFQTPGDASLRMFPGRNHPFEFIREMTEQGLTVKEKVLKDKDEAS